MWSVRSIILPRTPLTLRTVFSLHPVTGLSHVRNQGDGPGQHIGSDFPGLYQNVVEDAAGASEPDCCKAGGSALAAPKVSAADAPRGGTNPLFCADRQRHSTSSNSTPAGQNGSSFGGVAVGASNGGRAATVFYATELAAGGPAVENSSSETGGGPAVQVRYSFSFTTVCGLTPVREHLLFEYYHPFHTQKVRASTPEL